MKHFILDGNYVENFEDFGQEICALAEDGESGELPVSGEISPESRKPIMESRKKRTGEGNFGHHDRIHDWISNLTLNDSAILHVKNSAKIQALLGVEHAIQIRRDALERCKKNTESPDNNAWIAGHIKEIQELESGKALGTFDEILEHVNQSKANYPHPLTIILE